MLIEGVEQLLPGSRAGKRSAVIESSAEAAKVKQPFRSTVKSDAHAIEQIDDRGRCLAHIFHRRLVGEKVTAVNGVVKVLPGSVALALQILRGIDAALRAHRMRALHWNDRK